MRIAANIFFRALLILVLSQVASGAEDRIDLDLRLEPKNEKNFYLLKENFESKDVIKIEGNEYKIVRSQNELFVDDYYDTKLHSLLKKKASLRYRKRFINSTDSKNLIQFKTQKSNDKLAGMNEFKITMDSDETLISYHDLKKYLNIPKNRNSELHKQLGGYVNISKLDQIFSATQYRDRFYLQNDKEETIFTISFDEVVYSKDLSKKTYLVVEFEINEIIMANANKMDSSILLNGLNEFIKNLDKENVLFNRIYDNKYSVGIKKLEIKPTPENLIEIILTFLALLFIIFLFSIPIFSRIFRQKNLDKQYKPNN